MKQILNADVVAFARRRFRHMNTGGAWQLLIAGGFIDAEVLQASIWIGRSPIRSCSDSKKTRILSIVYLLSHVRRTTLQHASDSSDVGAGDRA